MSDQSFVQVPIPSRFVLRVMSSVAAWVVDEEDLTSEPADVAEVWPTSLLVKIRQGTKVSLLILTKTLDQLSKTPGKRFTLGEISTNIDEDHGSVSEAFRQLGRRFKEDFGRSDTPYSRWGSRFFLNEEQAKAWLASQKEPGATG